MLDAAKGEAMEAEAKRASAEEAARAAAEDAAAAKQRVVQVRKLRWLCSCPRLSFCATEAEGGKGRQMSLLRASVVPSSSTCEGLSEWQHPSRVLRWAGGGAC